MRIVTKQYIVMVLSVILWGLIYTAAGITATAIVLTIVFIGYVIQVQVDKKRITDEMISELISKMQKEEEERLNKKQ